MAVRRERKPVAADCRRAFFPRRGSAGPALAAGKLVRFRPDFLWRHPEDISARRIDVAGDPHEDEDRPGRLEGVCGHIDAVAPLDAGRPGGRKGSCSISDE